MKQKIISAVFALLLTTSILAGAFALASTPAKAQVSGDLIISGSEDGTVRAISGSDQTQQWGHSTTDADFRHSAMSANGEEVYMAETFATNEIRAYYTSNGSLKWSYNPGSRSTAQIYGVGSSWDNERVYVSTSTNRVVLDASDGSVIRTDTMATFEGRAIQGKPGGGYVLGDNNGDVRSYDSSGTLLWSSTLLGGYAVATVEIDPQTGDVYALSFGEEAQSWTSDGAGRWEKSINNGAIRDMKFNTDNGYVYAVGYNAEVFEIDSGTGNIADSTSLPGTSNQLDSVSISSDGNYLYTGDEFGARRANSLVDWSEAWIENSHSDAVYTISSTGDKNFTASYYLNGTVTSKTNDEPIANVSVKVYQGGSLITDTYTDSNGEYSFELEEGDYTVEASKKDYTTESKTTTLNSDTTVNLSLAGYYDVKGYVRENTKEGSPIADANVEVYQNGVEQHSAITNNSGYYNISDIEGGNYTFNVSTLGYEDVSTEKFVNGDKQYDFRLNNKEGEYVPYMEFKTPSWIASNDSRSYHVYFSDETGEYKEVTENANVTSLNISRLKVNTTSLELEGVAGINATVNVTAEYVYQNTTYKQTNEVAVAKLEVAQLEILPPSHRISAFLRDSNVQMIIVAVIVGTTAAYLTANPFAGLGGIQLALMIAWSNDRLNTGILLIGFYYMLFAGMLGMQVRKQRH